MQTLEMLEKKEKVLVKKASAEVEKAKEFTKAKNKRGMKFGMQKQSLLNYTCLWISYLMYCWTLIYHRSSFSLCCGGQLKVIYLKAVTSLGAACCMNPFPDNLNFEA